jgi:2-hydroxycyclohexanecarboxyl-CoA dehydrogenase
VARRSGSAGPTTVVTGGANGIGRAVVERLLGRGDTIGVFDRDISALEDLRAEVPQSPGLLRTYAVDVLDRDGVRAACRDLVDEFGGIDYAFANAGVDRRVPMTDMELVDWEVVLGSHATGSFNLCQAVLPHMSAPGAILLMASDFAVAALPGQANYTAAKTAVYSLAKALAVEFAGRGIRVNAIGPGPVDTALLRAGRSGEDWEVTRRRIEGRVPMGRLAQPDEIAGTVDYLLSRRSAYITGQLLQPNGGQVIW